MFKKVLVANRGEIARRVLRTCQRVGVRTVAVFSDADVTAPHVVEADEAVRLGPPPVGSSYLDLNALGAAVEFTGADAVHPGYGLLSESPSLAEVCLDLGVEFIGPSATVLRALGDKIQARRIATQAGCLLPAATPEPVDPSDEARVLEAAGLVGYPLVVKAVAGGGGIGMARVDSEEQLKAAARTCSDRSRAAFGDSRIYLEAWIASPRHIEVQALRDQHGYSAALGIRECSVQRRYQKLIEESPSECFQGPDGAKDTEKLCELARRVLDEAGYVGVATVEFVVDGAGVARFLEVNARLQVEHPVTEMRYAIDLVELQLAIASGDSVREAVSASKPEGHAIEVRLYAEDPARGFLPQPGRVTVASWPQLPHIRVEAGVEAGGELSPHYDPLIAKIIAHGGGREQARQRLIEALTACDVQVVAPKGPRKTNREFLLRVLESDAFRSGCYDTSIVESLLRRD